MVKGRNMLKFCSNKLKAIYLGKINITFKSVTWSVEFCCILKHKLSVVQ